MAFVKEDIVTLRESARIDDIVGEVVTLRPAGVGSLKGLCPFHDERTPSFHVRPPVGHWHCFGCGEGGDVISFVQKFHHMSFPEAVQWLSEKTGVQVRDDGEGGRRTQREEPGRRQRLVEVNAVAHEFFREQLDSPEAAIGRTFLTERGFDAAASASFEIGFAPKSWDTLLKHLRGRGFTEAELLASGVVTQGNRGVYDRFRGRLIWPIKDITGTVVGFGARQLGDDEDGAKYLNTPETPLYKKSQVLYGLDRAKKAISTKRQVVVVEGYTDVMACHLAGIDTAVATCGTAFGEDHIRMIRRLLGDVADSAAGVAFSASLSRGGEVIFTFDGDAAGQKAALRAFDQDQKFAAQTFVAVEPSGMDPCELRQTRGDEALTELIARREPLFAFAIRAAMETQNLETVEGRVGALRAVAPVVAGIRDNALRSEYARIVAGRLSMDADQVRRAVANVGRGRQQEPAAMPERRGNDPVVKLEREALEVALQFPDVAQEMGFDDLEGDTFMVPAHRAVHDVIRAGGGVSMAPRLGPAQWIETLCEDASEPVAVAISGLAVAPMPANGDEAVRKYAYGVMTALLKMSITRTIAAMRGELSRVAEGTPEYDELFANLVALETARRELETLENQ